MAVQRIRGFSLVETTIAIGIVGMMIVATSAFLQRLPVNGREVRDQDIALRIAQSEIETLRASGYDALPVSGPFTNPLLDSLATSTASVTIIDYSARAKRADVQVSWQGNDDIARQVTLTTLITQSSGL